MNTLLKIERACRRARPVVAAGRALRRRLAGAAIPTAESMTRDLAADPVPHLTAERFQAFGTKPEARTRSNSAVVAYSDALIDEIKKRRHHRVRRADVQLQRAVDAARVLRSHRPRRRHVSLHRHRAGRSAQGKKAYVFITRGGVYADGGRYADAVPAAVPRLHRHRPEFVFAEGLAMGDEARQKSVAEARAQIADLTAVALAA